MNLKMNLVNIFRVGQKIEILEKEKNAKSNGNSNEDNDSTDNNTVNINDIIHPTIDANAKWKLFSKIT